MILYILCVIHILGAEAPRTPPLGGEITKDGDYTIFWFDTSAHIITYLFDYCDVVHCPPTQLDSLGHGTQYICVADKYWGDKCEYWAAAAWNTGDSWGYKPPSALNRKDKDGKSLIDRMRLTKQAFRKGCSTRGECNRLIRSIENPSPGDAGTYIMSSTPPSGERKPPVQYSGKFKLANAADKPNVTQETPSNVKVLTDPTYEETLAVETGFSETNYWLEWVRYTAQQDNGSGCYACAGARPHLGTVPLNIPESQQACFLSIYTNSSHSASCEHWKSKYPLMTKDTPPGTGITIYPGNYTCYTRTGAGRDVKNFTKGFCSEYSTTTDNLINHVVSLGDIYWICGDMKIRSRLEGVWVGQCALAKILMPFHLFPYTHESSPSTAVSRPKRASAPKGSFDPHVYIDNVGVPRGVPDEFKARDQVKAGFESLLPIITVNKNVDWINYVYYNQQRFVNYTRDALKGLADQLGPTSIMAFQNRMALDMILAEKGGVCKMIKDTCCTYIPDNTGPNGKVTVAIQKLTELSEELKQNSGVKDPWDQYFGWMNGWQRLLAQIGAAILVIFVLVIISGCCVIPCIRRMMEKTVKETTNLMPHLLLDEPIRIQIHPPDDAPHPDEDEYVELIGELRQYETMHASTPL
ncbi:uncharacterized protein LOC143809692 [Ranitomeya variabilis]|uniref:uncharacterized protein LOC143809692 n=1 Tax=Ranitomeya variabilis TaxID=490064 RepID=UPI0040560742